MSNVMQFKKPEPEPSPLIIIVEGKRVVTSAEFGAFFGYSASWVKARMRDKVDPIDTYAPEVQAWLWRRLRPIRKEDR